MLFVDFVNMKLAFRDFVVTFSLLIADRRPTEDNGEAVTIFADRKKMSVKFPTNLWGFSLFFSLPILTLRHIKICISASVL